MKGEKDVYLVIVINYFIVLKFRVNRLFRGLDFEVLLKISR